MNINAFEGARRIAMLMAGFWAIGVVAINFWERETRVEMVFAVRGPGLVWTRVAPSKTFGNCEFKDASESHRATTNAGTPVSVTLCFKAMNFKDDRLVPYRVDEKGMWWGATSYSDDVRKYTKDVAQNFHLSKADEEWADSQLWPVRWRKVMEASTWLFGGLLALWIFTVVVGWIVRGFLGIPSGQDARPKKAPDD